MKKGFRVKVFLIIFILTISIFTGCSKEEENKKNNIGNGKENPPIDVDPTEIDVMGEYEKLLQIEENRGDIALFLNDHIGKQSKKDASRMIIELEEYLDKNDYNIYESYILLNRYKKYVSLEIRSYLNILFTEGTKTYTDSDGLNISIDEALERAKTAEDHLIIFPNSGTNTSVMKLYKKYLNILIIGTEDDNILTEEDSTIIKEDIINLYRGEIKEIETKGISNIFNAYLRLLEKNGLDTGSKEAKKFKENLEGLIDEEFSQIEEGA